MRRMRLFGTLLLLVFLTVGFMLQGVKTANATDFTVTVIIKSSYNNYDVRLNNRGQIAYRTSKEYEYELYLYNDGEIAQISNSLYEIDHLQLNDQGQIAWRGFDGDNYEIFFHSNGITTQITDNEGGNNTRHNDWLNDNGNFVWWWSDGNWYGYEYDVYLSGGGAATRITNTTNYSESEARINNSGQIVWFRNDYDRSDTGLYLYSGGSTAEITHCQSCWPDSPKIYDLNDNGQVLWMGHDGTNYEIYLYSNGTNIQITDSDNVDSFSFAPQMNNNGQIVWAELDGNDYEIFLYSDGITTQITNNDFNDYVYPLNAQINDKGQIVWSSKDGDNYAVNLYSNGTVSQIINRSHISIENPVINNKGQVLWQEKWYQDGKYYFVILLATPTGLNKEFISGAVLQLLLF